MTRDELIKYWVNSSNQNFRTMLHLYRTKDYSWSLFIGHLVIEKLLKANYVKKYYGSPPPFIHDLYKIAVKTKLKLSQQQQDELNTISTFNISARYDDYKYQFYKKCNKEFSTIWINTIKKIRLWLKQELLKP